jgi:hypothetical protein
MRVILLALLGFCILAKEPETLDASNPHNCDPNTPNLSVGNLVVSTEKDLDDIKKFTFILGISDSTCEKCCQGEYLLKQIEVWNKKGEIALKGQQIPII